MDTEHVVGWSPSPRDSGCLLRQLVVVLMVLVNTCEQSQGPSGMKEYCKTENFKASCPDSEVIFMNSARFGRMQLGRCVTRNYGHLGCSEDVLSKMDARCSGRHQCALSVSDSALVRTEPCPQDFSSYLEAEYTCITVPTVDKERCRASSSVELPMPMGFIASVTTQENGCGSPSAPWVISALPGQRINVTLFDFGVSIHNETSPGKGHHTSRPLYCQQYAILEEPVTSRSTTVCGGHERVRNVYVSQTHRLHVSVINRKMTGHPKHFLLHYQVMDCPHLILPPRSHLRREGFKATVVCNATGESSVLLCEGSEWRGEVKNCSEATGPGTAREIEDPGGVGLPPLGVSVVIIVGVALVVVVYVAIMIICVMFLQRRRRRRAQAELVVKCQSSEISPVDLQMTKPCAHGSEERVPMLGKSPIGLHLHSAGGDYPDMRELAAARAALVQEGTVTILDTSPPPPGAENVPLPRCDCTTGTLPKNQGHYGVLGRPRPDRTYESPNRKKPGCQKYVRMADGVPCYYDVADPQGGAPGDTLPEPDVVTVTLYPMNHRHSNTAGASSGAAAERDNSANRIREQSL